MSDVEKIDFFTLPHCASCDLALHEILPIAKERAIPVHVLPAPMSIAFVPFACIIKKVNGIEEQQCIRGYDSNYSKDLIKLLD